jgi:hypothetical protein
MAQASFSYNQIEIKMKLFVLKQNSSAAVVEFSYPVSFALPLNASTKITAFP